VARNRGAVCRLCRREGEKLYLKGERFAEAARAVADLAGCPLDAVHAIASHGQTVAHHPELRATLQIGNPSLIAERTGCTTVADFRPRDVAAGGEGAPLAPFFHFAAFAEPREGRGILNLGGIANLTWIPRGAGPEDVVGFDVGPANALVDGVVRIQSGGRERMDRDGVRARSGRVDAGLLERLLDDEFLRRAPPKSTGRERYGAAEAEALAADAEGQDEEVLSLCGEFDLDVLEAIAAQERVPRVTGFMGSKHFIIGWIDKHVPKDAKSLFDAFAG